MSDLISFDTRPTKILSKLGAWRSASSESYFQVDVTASGNNDPEGRVARRSFGSIQMSALASSSYRVARPRQAIANDKIERFSIVFPTRGSFNWRVGCSEVKTEVGSYFVLNSSAEYEADHSDDSALVSLSAPCNLLRERVRGIDDFHSKARAVDGMSASTVRHFIVTAMAAGVRADDMRTEALCLSMLGLLLRRP